ncbi:MAG: hypothetical protein ACMUIP_14600 [bacterium]
MSKECPKCNYIRESEDKGSENECPRCGIIYEKYEEYLERKRHIAPHKQSDLKRYHLTFGIVSFIILALFSMSLFKKDTKPPLSSQSDKAGFSEKSSKRGTGSDNEENFSDSEELREILQQIQQKARTYDIEISMKDLRPYYNEGPGMISIPALSLSKAKEYGIPLPDVMEMTDEEFEMNKRYKCLCEKKGWVYYNSLPKTNEGISECWAQLYDYGKPIDLGDQLMFEADYRKSWRSRKWDPEQNRWVCFTKEEEQLAQRYMLGEKAQEVAARIDTYDYSKDYEQSQKLLTKYTGELKELKNELNTFDKKKLEHYEAVKKHRQFNQDDRKISNLQKKIRSVESRISSALIYEHRTRIKRIGFMEFLDRKGITL